MFEAYFFDKHTQTNYRIFRLLKARQDENFTINRLSVEAHLSYSQAYNAFQDIMAALQAKTRPIGAPLNESEFGRLSADVTVDDYRFYLLSQTTAFQFFDYIFRTPEPDVHNFCTGSSLSISTLRRRVAPFKRYLTSKGLRLNAGTWALEGDELRARILILTFYKMAYRGVGWPFSERSFQCARRRYVAFAKGQADLFGLPTTPTKQDLLILAIQALRIDQGHIMSVPERIPDLFAEMRQNQVSPLFNETEFPQLTPTQRNCERNFYDFIRGHFISLGPSMSKQDRALLAALAEKNPYAHHFATGLIDFLLGQCDPHSKEADCSQHIVLNANLHRMADAYLTFRGDFAKRLDFTNPDAPLAKHGHLPRLIKAYFAQLDRSVVGPLADYYIVIAPDFPSLNADHQLKVAVVVDAGTFMSRDLNSFLKAINFVDVVSPSRDVLPDVIVTTLSAPRVLKDYYSPERLRKIKIIHWQPEVADDDFFNLLNTLVETRKQLGN